MRGPIVCAGLLSLASLAGAGELAFYDIVPFAPGREARTAQDIRAVHEKTGLDTFLYSVSLDPRGYPAFDNVKRATESFRRLKAELGDAPVKLGFLLQSILGHWPRVDREIEPWQRSVNEDGEIKRFCIRDERYQDYIRRTAAALAATSFRPAMRSSRSRPAGTPSVCSSSRRPTSRCACSSSEDSIRVGSPRTDRVKGGRICQRFSSPMGKRRKAC